MQCHKTARRDRMQPDLTTDANFVAMCGRQTRSGFSQFVTMLPRYRLSQYFRPTVHRHLCSFNMLVK